MVPASTDLAATDLIEHITEGAGTKERSSTIGTMVLLDSAWPRRRATLGRGPNRREERGVSLILDLAVS
jgi:hypothetical protein